VEGASSDWRDVQEEPVGEGEPIRPVQHVRFHWLFMTVTNVAVIKCKWQRKKFGLFRVGMSFSAFKEG
jgi:hypothetical protein